MNHNEEFKRTLMIKMIDSININYANQQIIERILVELLQDYTIIKNETSLTVSDIPEKITMYLQAKKLEGLSDLTLQNYFYFLRRLSEHTHKQVRDITLNDLRMFLFKECEGVKPSTANTKVCYLQSFFKWMVDEEIIDKDPSRKLPQVKLPKRLRNSLTVEDIERLRLACSDKRERALIELLFATGCRLSELVGINVEDLNFQDNSIRVIGKGNKERIVYFNDKAKVHIENYLKERPGYSEALFVTCKRPYKRVGPRGVQKIINKIADKAGFDKSVFPHLFRHSMATLGLQNGASITTIQRLLGHCSITTTEKYTETNMETVKYEYKQSMTL